MHTADDRIMILNGNTRYPSSLLIIDPVLPCDSGWYTCTAFNDAGHSSQRIHVEVHCKIDVYSHDHDILECFGNLRLSFITCLQSNRFSNHILPLPKHES